MAKGKNAAETDPNAPPPDMNDQRSSEEAGDIDLSGFQKVNPEEARAWWRKGKGAFVFGEYLGRFKKGWEKETAAAPDGKFYHQIRLWRPCEAAMDKKDAAAAGREVIAQAEEGKDTVFVKLPMGAVVNVDENKRLEDLTQLSEGKWLVYIKSVDRRKISGGKTMWDFEVQKKTFTEKDSPF